MKSIINFGSLNLDFVYTVNHVVQPGETVASMDRQLFFGGKGLNQSIALAKAGARVYHAGKYGRNDGAVFRQLLSSAGAYTEYMEAADGPSGHAIIQVDCHGQNSIILYGGVNRSFSEEYVDRILEHFGNGDCLLVQNEINLIPYIMKKAKERCISIVFNPSPVNQDMGEYPLELVDTFILNEIEGVELVYGMNPSSPASGQSPDGAKLAEMMSLKYPNSEVLLTLAQEGCILRSSLTMLYQKAYGVDAVDTTAAGDTFTGYYLASRLQGDTSEQALKLASAAAAIAVTRRGAYDSIPDRNEVENFLKKF